MASDSSRRKSFLTLTPVDFSLTAGTNIPAPPDTPPRSPSPVITARPPTAGGGPLSSHPTSAEDINSSAALPPTPDPDNEVLAKMSTSTSSNNDMDRTDSFRTPASPASAQQKHSKAEQQKHGQSVRKLFSLGNLRNSFSSSRTSLHAKSPSAETSPRQPQAEPSQRPASSQTIQPQMRPRTKSGSWFRRKSGLFMLNGEDLDSVAEDHTAARDNVRRISKQQISAPTPVKEVHNPVPLLPEIGGLGNGTTNGGDLGWDEGMFKR